MQKKKEFSIKANSNLVGDIYNSYNLSLNSKYKVRVFNETMERVKNYFR